MGCMSSKTAPSAPHRKRALLIQARYALPVKILIQVHIYHWSVLTSSLFCIPHPFHTATSLLSIYAHRHSFFPRTARLCNNLPWIDQLSSPGSISSWAWSTSGGGGYSDTLQELEVRSLNHPYSLKTKSSQCHYVTAIQMCLKFSFTPGHYYVMTLWAFGFEAIGVI